MKKDCCLLLSRGSALWKGNHWSLPPKLDVPQASGMVDSALENSCAKGPAHRESDAIVPEGTGAFVLFEATR